MGIMGGDAPAPAAAAAAGAGAGAGGDAGAGVDGAAATLDVASVASFLMSLRAGAMKAVKPKAQRFVVVPAGLDLDVPISTERVRGVVV